MASIVRDPNGRKRVQFVDLDGSRKSIRLGKVSVKDAEAFSGRVERLLASRITGAAIDSDMARWLTELPDAVHVKLEHVGLTEAREIQSHVMIGAFLADVIEAADVKPASKTCMNRAANTLCGFFGSDRGLGTVTELDAEDWRSDLRQRGYSTATISRTVRYARQMWRPAIKRGLVDTNPFEDLKAGPQTNVARQVFVDTATIQRVLDAAPDAEWRLLIALARYGGLRVPSEALALTWADVNWEHSRLTIRSRKTEHHEGGGERVIPIFPELREHLLEVFDQAPDGETRVITSYRSGSNLNPQLRRIIQRAGLVPWPRTWHNLRASRQTELAMTYPLHTVCAWIGNTKAIAAGHYLQLTDADWERAIRDPDESEKAAHNPAQYLAATACTLSQRKSLSVDGTGDLRLGAAECETTRNPRMGRGGLEPPTPAFSMRCSTN